MMILVSDLILIMLVIYLFCELIIPSFSSKEYWWIYKQIKKENEAEKKAKDSSEDNKSSEK